MSDNRINGECIMNGTEKKSPFLIGVAGGTASGKVNPTYSISLNTIIYTCRVRYAQKSWKN